MSRLATIRSAVTDCFPNGRLWLVQFLANPILFALFVAWLLIPVANTWHLVLNLLLALALLVSVLVLQAGTLKYFSDRQSGPVPLWPAFRSALKHLAAIAVCALVFYLLWALADSMQSSQDNFSAFVRSLLPAFLRRHVALPTLDKLFAMILFAFRWILVPGLLLPFALQTAVRGFRGFGSQGRAAWKRAVSSLAYWLVLLFSSLLGVWLTEALMAWTPDFQTSTLSHEAVSLAFRLFFAYVFGLFAWILACSVVGRHSVLPGSPSDLPGNPAA
jgi:hypothetical protein